ncbi:hypothetical protein L208DRAFT_1277734 [Tricholoma matsutake]|nr:hypothetical protein L208DRAFT_1277734 [Tricholoma matsutake 945]
MPDSGHFIIAASLLFFLVASYAVFFSAFTPSIPVLDALANDMHYKYFAILVIPTSAYFIIANWVGWQYYRNS